MFHFKGSARGFATLCVAGAIFLFATDKSQPAYFVLFLGFFAFVLSLLSRK